MRAPTRGSVAAWAAEVGIYLLVALYAVAPTLGTPGAVPGAGTDLHGTIWFYWWIDECVRSLQSPSHTDLFFHPYGKHIFAHTGNHFLDALVATPVHALLGPVAFARWWVILVVVGNALAMRPLARTVVQARWAVVLAAALWAANPYFALELHAGRITQVFAWALPLAFLGLLRLEGSRAWVVGTGVAVALVGYAYWYYAFFFAFAALWLVAVEVWSRRGERERLRRYLVRVAAAAGIAVALVLPPVLALAGTAGGPTLLPGRPLSLSAGMYDSYLPWVTGGPMLEALPWLLGLALWLALGRGRLRWGGVLVAGLALAVGPAQVLGGREVPMLHYQALYALLPWFHRLSFPYRALVLVWLALSLGLGTVAERGLRALAARWSTLPRWLVPAAVLALVLWALLDDAHLPLPVTPVPELEVYAWLETQGGALVDLPLDVENDRFVHQVRHPIPVFAGMGGSAPHLWPEAHRQRARSPCVETLRAATSADLGAPVGRADCTPLLEQGFRWLVLHRDLQKGGAHRVATDRLSHLFGPPVAVDGPLLVWSLDASGQGEAPASLAPTPERVRRPWDRETAPPPSRTERSTPPPPPPPVVEPRPPVERKRPGRH